VSSSPVFHALIVARDAHLGAELTVTTRKT
jgi:hypothetical protein